MVFDERIGRDRVGALESVPHIAPVGADLAELAQRAHGDVADLSLARDPDLANAQQTVSATDQVGAGELDAEPLLAFKRRRR